MGMATSSRVRDGYFKLGFRSRSRLLYALNYAAVNRILDPTVLDCLASLRGRYFRVDPLIVRIQLPI